MKLGISFSFLIDDVFFFDHDVGNEPLDVFQEYVVQMPYHINFQSWAAVHRSVDRSTDLWTGSQIWGPAHDSTVVIAAVVWYCYLIDRPDLTQDILSP